jgi:SAM-dependent methyltransferase
MQLVPEAGLVVNRYAFVRDYLASNPAPSDGGVLYDIGAGALPMKTAVEEAGYEWFGFDLQPKSAGVTQWDIDTPLEGERRADLVLLMDVIEHTFNPGMAMKHIHKVLSPGGTVIVTMPNPKWSRARTLHFFTGFIAAFTQADLDLNHHVFATWPHIVHRLVLDAGFVIEKYVTLDLNEGARTSFAPIHAIERLVRNAMEATDPSSRGMSYAFILKASPTASVT